MDPGSPDPLGTVKRAMQGGPLLERLCTWSGVLVASMGPSGLGAATLCPADSEQGHLFFRSLGLQRHLPFLRNQPSSVVSALASIRRHSDHHLGSQSLSAGEQLPQMLRSVDPLPCSHRCGHRVGPESRPGRSLAGLWGVASRPTRFPEHGAAVLPLWACNTHAGTLPPSHPTVPLPCCGLILSHSQGCTHLCGGPAQHAADSPSR